MKWTAGTIVMTMLLVSVARAQPASAPADADATTPKGMLIVLARATQAGNAAAVKNLFHATKPMELKMVDVIADRAQALMQIREAATKAFGNDVADRIAPSTIDEDRIRTAQVRIDGDKAMVGLKDTQQPFILIKADGTWKMLVSPIVEGKSDAEIQEVVDQMNLLAQVTREAATELNQGKYKTPQELDDAIRGKRAWLMMGAHATTAPAAPAPQR